jgi:superfamily II DNA or RNA helicase
MTARLCYLGRALSLEPAGLGELFEKDLTVHRSFEETTEETFVDSVTGEERSFPVRQRKTEAIAMFWYHENRFCAYAGYGPRIIAGLKARGLEVAVSDLVSDGLDAPDLSLLKQVFWRTKQKQVFAALLAFKRGMIVCPPAFGKSYIICQLARVYPKAKIVVTVPSADVCRRLVRDLEPLLGGSQVSMVGGGKSRVSRVSVVVSQSLHHAPKDANLILCDECHMLMTKNYVQSLNRFRRARIFGFTASPDRPDGASGLGEAMFGPVLLNVSYQEAVAGGNVVPLVVRMIRSPGGPDLSSVKNHTVVNRRGLWRNKSRNNLVAQCARQLQEELGPDSQLLIVVDVVEHAYVLGQLLPEFEIVTGTPTAERVEKMIEFGAMTEGQQVCTREMRIDAQRRFESHELKYVICNKVWRQGVDFRDLRALIRADGLATCIDACQVPGRLSRLGDKTDKQEGILVDFYDTFTKQLQARAEARIKEYTKHGWKVTRIG